MLKPRLAFAPRVLLGAAVMFVFAFPATTEAGRSPYESWRTPKPKKTPPPAVPVPIVVKCPTTPVDWGNPATDGPGFPSENPTHTPEPASVVSGLVGSGLVLATWLRKRRRQVNLENTEG